MGWSVGERDIDLMSVCWKLTRCIALSKGPLDSLASDFPREFFGNRKH